MTRPITILRNRIRNDFHRIPDFVNTRNTEHHLAYNIICGTIYSTFSVFCQNKFFTYYECEELAADILIAVAQIRDLTNLGFYVNVYKFLKARCEEYEELCNQLEVYEASQNFKRLGEILTGIKIKNKQ